MASDELTARRQKKCGASREGHALSHTGGTCSKCGIVMWTPTPPPPPPLPKPEPST